MPTRIVLIAPIISIVSELGGLYVSCRYSYKWARTTLHLPVSLWAMFEKTNRQG